MKRILIRNAALFTFLWLVTACLPSGKNNTSLSENWIAEDESAAMHYHWFRILWTLLYLQVSLYGIMNH